MAILKNTFKTDFVFIADQFKIRWLLNRISPFTMDIFKILKQRAHSIYIELDDMIYGMYDIIQKKYVNPNYMYEIHCSVRYSDDLDALYIIYRFDEYKIQIMIKDYKLSGGQKYADTTDIQILKPRTIYATI